MKKIILTLSIVVALISNSKAQTPLTISNREIYDFNVGDEFQYIRDGYGVIGLPDILRYTITGKYYSPSLDSVFYNRHFSNYSRSLTPTGTFPPYIVNYSFSSGNDVVSYTNLDTIIYGGNHSYLMDSSGVASAYSDTIYYSTEYCNSLLYKIDTCTGCNFEPNAFTTIYGKGLGITLSQHQFTGFQHITESTTLFYYKKDTLVCGSPDTLTAAPVALHKMNTVNTALTLSPNPTSSELTVYSAYTTTPTYITISNVVGQVVQRNALTAPTTTLNVATLPNGMYVLKTNTGQISKFVKE